MKLILVTICILLFFTIKSEAGTTSAIIEYTIGIDDGTDTLLPGSDWRLEIAPTFASECYDISPELNFHKSTLVPVLSYIDRDSECSASVHAGFEDETYISWEDFGFEQRPEFGVENITCPIYGSCEMNRVVNTEDKFYDDLTLENGEHGTSNGAAKIFITKLGNSTVQSIPGTGGTGGINDLSSITPVNRYCAKVQDAVSADSTTLSSKVPYATIHAYNWLPLNIGNAGAHGTDAPSGKIVEIYEGLSPTTLHRLKGEYLQ